MLGRSKSPPALALATRRVLAFGPALTALAEGPLDGALIEPAPLSRLAGVTSAETDLVLIDADAWDAADLAQAIQALAATPAPPPVLLLGEHLPAGVVRNLMRLARSDVLDAPASPERIRAAVTGLTAVAGPAHVATARCWAVSGAVGGAGATTLAVEIATELCSRQLRNRSVCLIDLNLADGAAAAYLGSSPAMRLADFAQTPERIDAAILQAFATPVTGQLDLLAAQRAPEGFDGASREAVLHLLDVACETYDWVILDLPRHRQPWTLEVLSGCDEVLVISELTVPALIAARSLSDEIEAGLSGALKPRIVLNRLASKMFGPAPSMAEAERALQRKAEAGVSSDWEAAAASANLGGPIATHRPKSKIVKDVQALVARLADQPARQKAA